ncbi:MAG TPA: lysylphosphatidylglycerol synthase transmembrane domain-containing protein [Verrucomicrobiae bacterium]|nr:lysylphosphatidylglycerol synthase transmembrane domain-containing protein [Verrucomicrobiae bacterium]
MWSRALRLSASILLPAVFLYLFFRGIDLARLGESLRNVGAGWWLLLLAAGVQVVHCFLRAARWRILLGPLKKDVGYYNLISTISIGYMVTMLLPGRLGEVLRPVLLAGRENISKGGAIATILLERLMDALTVASLFAIYLIFFLGPEGGMGREAAAGMSVGWGVAMGLFIVLAFPLLYAVVHFRARVASLLERVVSPASRTGETIHKIFHTVVDGFQVIKGGRALIAAWSYSYLIWLVIAFSIWFSVKAFGIDLPLSGSLLMLGALTFGIAIPTQGGVGTYEWFGQQALTRFFGVDPSAAAAAILVMHVFAVGPVIIMGFAFLWKEGLSFSGITAGVRSGGGSPAPGPEAQETPLPAPQPVEAGSARGRSAARSDR